MKINKLKTNKDIKKKGEFMKEAQMHLINKMFNDKTIRTVWNKEEEKYYISVIDILTVLMENDYQESRNYWKVLKHRLKKEGNETVTNCNQLKLKASDGKYRLTDVVDIVTALVDNEDTRHYWNSLKSR